MVFAFGYNIFIWVCLLHLSMLFSFGYALCISVCSFHLGMLFAFGYNIFIWVAKPFAFERALFILVYMLFAFEHALFIWVCSLHLSVLFSFGYGLFIWIYYRHVARERKLASPNMELFSVNSVSTIILLLASFTCTKQRPKREHQKL